MPERLNKYLAAHAGLSRRAADGAIDRGEVTINGETARLGQAVAVGDTVELKGRAVRAQTAEFIYYALYKPRGVISSAKDERGRRGVVDLVPSSPRVFPVGRLDKDSEGLLILTNDGELALKLTHPRYEHEKEYAVVIQAADPKVLKFTSTRTVGVDILKADERTGMATLKVILKEGKNRQIRRMVESRGAQVISLKRVRIGKLTLGNLKAGEWRIVSKAQLL